MRDIGVVNLPSGAPTLALTGGARARVDALTPPGQAIDAINIQTVAGNYGRYPSQVVGSNLARQQSQYMALLALPGNPLLVALGSDRRETHLKAQLVCAEQNILEHRR